MIDPKLLRTDPDLVRRSQEARGESVGLVDDLVAADAARRDSIASFEALRAEQKELGKLVPKAVGDEKQALLARTKDLAGQVKEAESASLAAAAQFDEFMGRLPNLVFDDVPQGGEDDFVVVETIGQPRDFAAEGFEPRDHLDLGQILRELEADGFGPPALLRGRHGERLRRLHHPCLRQTAMRQFRPGI